MRRINAGTALLALTFAGSIAGAQTLDRSKAPTLGPPPKVSLPPVVTRQLPNGLKLMVVEQHELPLADFVLVLGCGGTRAVRELAPIRDRPLSRHSLPSTCLI